MHRGDAEDAEIISLRFGGSNVGEPSHPKVEHSPAPNAEGAFTNRGNLEARRSMWKLSPAGGE